MNTNIENSIHAIRKNGKWYLSSSSENNSSGSSDTDLNIIEISSLEQITSGAPDGIYVIPTNSGTSIISADTYIKKGNKLYKVTGGEGTSLPSVTSADKGKFLRVSSQGDWVAESLQDVSKGGM